MHNRYLTGQHGGKALPIQFTGLTTGYRDRKQTRIISRNLSGQVTEGELVFLMGPNGCGKSTLMNSLSGIIPKIEGEVRLAGKRIEEVTARERARLISLVLTDRITAPQLRVSEVIEVGRYPYVGALGHLSLEDKEIIHEAIKQCRLEGYGERFFVELSDGEKQRVMMARAYAQETPVMLLDEPTAHLDLPSRLEVMTTLHALTRTTTRCVIICTHELDLALQWADRLWLMDREGQLHIGAPEDHILSGTVEKILGNENLSFDQMRGEFFVQSDAAKSISINGPAGLRLTWTLHALQRVGYHTELVEYGATLQVKEDGWVYNGEVYGSLYSLLADLGKDFSKNEANTIVQESDHEHQ